MTRVPIAMAVSALSMIASAGDVDLSDPVVETILNGSLFRGVIFFLLFMAFQFFNDLRQRNKDSAATADLRAHLEEKTEDLDRAKDELKTAREDMVKYRMAWQMQKAGTEVSGDIPVFTPPADCEDTEDVHLSLLDLDAAEKAIVLAYRETARD
jgi:hypothetical protein